MVYHVLSPYEGDAYTATLLFGHSETGVEASHWSMLGTRVLHSVPPVPLTAATFNNSSGAFNNVAIRTDRDGTKLEVNGTLVLDVPGHELRPRRGYMAICAGIIRDEPEEYSIEVAGVRAWTDVAWRLTD